MRIRPDGPVVIVSGGSEGTITLGRMNTFPRTGEFLETGRGSYSVDSVVWIYNKNTNDLEVHIQVSEV